MCICCFNEMSNLEIADSSPGSLNRNSINNYFFQLRSLRSPLSNEQRKSILALHFHKLCHNCSWQRFIWNADIVLVINVDFGYIKRTHFVLLPVHPFSTVSSSLFPSFSISIYNYCFKYDVASAIFSIETKFRCSFSCSRFSSLLITAHNQITQVRGIGQR